MTRKEKIRLTSLKYADAHPSDYTNEMYDIGDIEKAFEAGAEWADATAWKPSIEQLEALWCAAEKYLESDNANVVELRGKVLESLYHDLKKLTGE